ncbi:MAG: universal stress protein [Hyphomicrobiales bacterium]|nr:universal stress protein [Hyphomicrobiales bacterium]
MTSNTNDIQMKKILVAIDGSDHARNALTLAGDLAQKYEARLFILHVVDQKPLGHEERHLAEIEFADRLASFGLDEPPEALQGYGRIGLGGFMHAQHQRNAAVKNILGEELLNIAKQDTASGGITEVETMLLNGDPAEKILETADRTGANLVVIGSRGLSDLGGMWLGSVSHKVAHLSPVNVITVR